MATDDTEETQYEYYYDLKEKTVITECNAYPTDISQDETHWLWVINNKYDDESVDSKKVGKWMLFLPKDKVNPVWDKIKAAIRSGDLWHSKVSTSTTEPGQSNHAIMIYTKDYTDLNDVVHVLNFLESSGIKEPLVNIKYKTDNQTRAGVYSGGGQRPWIYTSSTIRGKTSSSIRNPYNWRDRP